MAKRVIIDNRLVEIGDTVEVPSATTVEVDGVQVMRIEFYTGIVIRDVNRPQYTIVPIEVVESALHRLN